MPKGQVFDKGLKAWFNKKWSSPFFIKNNLGLFFINNDLDT